MKNVNKKNISIKLPYQVEKALYTLENKGYEAFIVGGCVRDALLGKVAQDFDIATLAEPPQVIYAFPDFHVIETGLKHGTVTVVIDKMPIEITTYRIDGKYTDNRRPESVSFTKSLLEDLKRRDFTINAMAYNPKNGLIDFFDSVGDLEKKIIRCVGNSGERFDEDALRIIRALRFASVLGFDIDAGTSMSIHEKKSLLLNIAKERIMLEFTKLLCGDGAEGIILKYSDVFEIFMSESINIDGHTAETAARVPKDLALRLAAFFHDIGETSFTGSIITKKILTDLKYDRTTIDRVGAIVLHQDEEIKAEKRHLKRMLNKLGVQLFKDILALKKAHHENVDTLVQMTDEIISEGECFSVENLDINGLDIKKTGIPEGREIGRVLNHLLECVIDEKIKNTKEELLKEAKNFLGLLQ